MPSHVSSPRTKLIQKFTIVFKRHSKSKSCERILKNITLSHKLRCVCTNVWESAAKQKGKS